MNRRHLLAALGAVPAVACTPPEPPPPKGVTLAVEVPPTDGVVLSQDGQWIEPPMQYDELLILGEGGRELVSIAADGKVTLHGDPHSAKFWFEICDALKPCGAKT